MLAKNAAKRMLPGRYEWMSPVDDSETSPKRLIEPMPMAWPDNVPKPRIGLVKDADVFPYWTHYRSFLQRNDIPFEIYDIHRSDWRRRAEEFDIIVWRPLSFPYELDEARRKAWILENHVGVMSYPTTAEALIYEDKTLQYELLEHYGFPAVATCLTHSKEEALAFARAASYPLVWKIDAGSGSLGVELVRSRRAAERRIRAAFSHSGRRTYWPYLAQKDYVYLQPLAPNAGYDLRVLVVGDYAFGVYRAVPKGEFRASGMHTAYYDALPAEAMLLARRVRDRLGVLMLALDMLVDERRERYSIIELSMFTQTPDPWYLRVDDVPGLYVFAGDAFEFVSGHVLLQHLILEELLKQRWIAPRLLAPEAAAISGEGATGTA